MCRYAAVKVSEYYPFIFCKFLEHLYITHAMLIKVQRPKYYKIEKYYSIRNQYYGSDTLFTVYRYKMPNANICLRFMFTKILYLAFRAYYTNNNSSTFLHLVPFNINMIDLIFPTNRAINIKRSTPLISHFPLSFTYVLPFPFYVQ